MRELVEDQRLRFDLCCDMLTGESVEDELQKLRIDKAHKARRDERSVWPWVVVVLSCC